MPVKILLIGARLCRNLGGPSLFITTRAVLDRVFTDTEYTFVTPTAEDLPLAERYEMSIILTVSGKKLVLAALARRFLRVTLGTPDIRKLLDAYAEADIIVDIWGIGFCDSFGRSTFRTSVLSGGRFLVGKLFGKPVVKYTADLGPFESRWNRFFSKFYFNHTVDLILARSDVTRERLLRLGVKTPIRVCPDTAFLLEPYSCQFAEELAKEKGDHPIAGFSVSHMAARQSGDLNDYVQSMAQLADYVIGNINARIVLIPNEFSSCESEDDVHIAELVKARMKRKDKAVIVPGEKYTAQQLKGIIGQCDVVVASRYHTIVAALSQSIPVLAIGWHAKYHAVLRLTGQEDSLCSVKSLEPAILKEKFDKLWHLRDRIRQEITASLPKIEQAIFSGGEEVGLLLEKKSSGTIKPQ